MRRQRTIVDAGTGAARPVTGRARGASPAIAGTPAASREPVGGAVGIPGAAPGDGTG